MVVRFELIHVDRDTGARAGRLYTPHGIVHTPVFMPVGTHGTIRALTPEEVESAGAEIVLANTFHLSLRPGGAIIHRAGGLHAFMHWARPILTDSGGYQVFSLPHLRRVADEGVVFRSPIDGDEVSFTPERVVQIEEQLGADIVMPLDVCLGYPTPHAEAAVALRRTLLWARRAKAAQRRQDQALFGIVQGGFDSGLRRQAADDLVALDFPGYAVGGLSVGEPKPMTYDLLSAVTERLPEARPRYLMGVGAPPSLVEGVRRGVDMFDCVMPTRIGRTGMALTAMGSLSLRQAAHAEDLGPIETGCPCPACRDYTRAYLRHLFKAGEMLGPRLVSLHNLVFMGRLAAEMRRAIREDRFGPWSRAALARYQDGVGGRGNRFDAAEPSGTLNRSEA
ncbi:MAG TPA: tRNA guanosine(34) transglycosylase Tgt [bacterium]|nr:tRNA guanosine(34) transglycosylase Tgt [bacterium]